jgi:hypothetical protein
VKSSFHSVRGASPDCFALLCGLIVLGSLAAARGNTNPPPTAIWDATARATVGGGYRANVLQTSVAPEDSAFFQSGAELSLDRLSQSGAWVSLFLLGEDTRYFDSPSVPSEQLLSGSARAILPLGDRDRLGGLLQYLYQHQVLDVSETETNLNRLLIKGHSLSLRPDWRHTLSADWSVQVEGLMNRQWYVGELDDYWEGGGRLTLARGYGHRSELSLSGQTKRLLYDTRRQTDASGAPLAGTSLLYWQHEAAAQWRHHWDESRHWQTRLRAGFMANRDNAAGYFDYDRVQFSATVRWQNRGWEANAAARLGWYLYGSQQVGGRLRERSYCTLDGRVERRLWKHGLLYAKVEKDWNNGNDPLERFEDWLIGGGVGIEF